MAMDGIWLAADGGNEHVAGLLADSSALVDRLKVGSWMGEQQLSAIAAAQPTLLHVSYGAIWPRGRRWIDRQIHLTRLARTPWVSVHLDLGSTFLAYRWPGPSPIPPSLARIWAVRTLRRWAARSPVPLIAENMPRWSRTRPAYLVEPGFITEVIEAADCGLLLDLAHARVAACMRQQPVREYIEELPIDRLIEVHVSGPRPDPGHGRLTDAHQSLEDEDYALLQWVLEKVRPRAVTVECWCDRALLKEQLQRLRQVLLQRRVMAAHNS